MEGSSNSYSMAIYPLGFASSYPHKQIIRRNLQLLAGSYTFLVPETLRSIVLKASTVP